MVDVGDEDGHPLGGDPPGEALPAGDPDAALDLLLDASGGAGQQLIGVAVVQEDGDGVDGQDVLDPEQELVEELLQPQLGERRVAEPRQAPDLLRRGEVGSDRRQHGLPHAGGGRRVKRVS